MGASIFDGVVSAKERTQMWDRTSVDKRQLLRLQSNGRMELGDVRVINGTQIKGILKQIDRDVEVEVSSIEQCFGAVVMVHRAEIPRRVQGLVEIPTALRPAVSREKTMIGILTEPHTSLDEVLASTYDKSIGKKSCKRIRLDGDDSNVNEIRETDIHTRDREVDSRCCTGGFSCEERTEEANENGCCRGSIEGGGLLYHRLWQGYWPVSAVPGQQDNELRQTTVAVNNE
ncbi:hypothetical protein DFJ58DRAFT_848292 [Suillus subalutaceus]|uniref:uncharacterized protein n=1 Tax=Suillus subalutaceus TaxID=48586 RepID=UPI001B86C470|nr:uncharacterized protein DFJ58DRAFT_848292 [Suillus subalutaceus]KAG1831193.1 hypothetical protein DFJ58DRAFT_848292 [Suillus subalutaceus]